VLSAGHLKFVLIRQYFEQPIFKFVFIYSSGYQPVTVPPTPKNVPVIELVPL